MQKESGARHFKRVGKVGATTACDVDDVGIPALFKQSEDGVRGESGFEDDHWLESVLRAER